MAGAQAMVSRGARRPQRELLWRALGVTLVGSRPGLSAAALSASLEASGDAGQHFARELAGFSIRQQWSADIQYDSDMIGMNLTNGRGKFYYDQIGQRYRMAYASEAHMFSPNATQYQDQLVKNVSGVACNLTVGPGKDGVCLPMKMPYWDFFGWVRNATRIGERVAEGEPCTVYENDEVVPGFFEPSLVHFQGCFNDRGVPRALSMVYTDVKSAGTQRFRFVAINYSNPGEQAFEKSFACGSNYPAKPCEESGVTTLGIYRIFGPPEPLELQNRDAGDALGDLAFLCTQASGAAYRSKLITHWRVNVSKVFGQYALCNYNGKQNVCAGSPEQLRYVGRRSSQIMGDGPVGGQCSPNEDVGSQYSFPAQAMCPQGVQPDALAASCAWGGATPVRTVQASCVLEERGLLEACKTEFGHAPFLRSKRIFEDALASSDPARGGCPDAAPERIATIVV